MHSLLYVACGHPNTDRVIQQGTVVPAFFATLFHALDLMKHTYEPPVVTYDLCLGAHRAIYLVVLGRDLSQFLYLKYLIILSL